MVWTFISFHLLQEWRKYHSNWAVHNFLFKQYEIYLLPIQKRLFYWKKPNRDHNSNRPFFINDTFGILNAKRPSRDKIKWWQDFSMHGKTNHGLDISCTLWYFQEEAINNFSNGKKVSFQWAVALIVFHLHLWYKVMVSYTYQLFLSHFLLWNVRYDLNRIPRYCFFNYLFKILSCEFFIMR